MDEAFVPLSTLLRDLGAPPDDVIDEELGVHSYVNRIEVAAPIELDIVVDEHGRVAIGSTPPLYYVGTSIRPSYHHVRFAAERDGSA